MSKAAKICSRPNCPHVQPCPVHARKPWDSSARKQAVGSRFRGATGVKRAHYVLDLHDGICHVCGKPGADQVDHVIPLSQGGPDMLDNLRPIHAKPCHQDKTAAEARAARS